MALEVILLAPNELSAISEVKELVQEHISDFRVFVTKMLGDDQSELPTGRIPILEAAQKTLDRRVMRLEAFILMVFGGVGVVKLIAWLAELWYHAQGALKR